MGQSLTTISEALKTIFFGEISAEAFAIAVLSGFPDDRKISGKWQPGLDYYVWSGGIPGSAEKKPVGTYWIANPYRADAILRRAAETVHRKLKDGTTWTGPRGIETVLTYHAGLQDADINLYIVAQAEIDDVPLDEQATRLTWLETETEMPWTALCLSGDTRPDSVKASGVRPSYVRPGKSLHAFKALLPTDLNTWVAIQHHLVVLLRSDPAIANPGRLMRLGGVVGREMDRSSGPARIQTALRAVPGAVDARRYLAALQGLAERQGIGDVEEAYNQLVYGAQVRKMAKTGRESAELDQIAEAVIATLKATDEQITRVKALTGGALAPGIRKVTGTGRSSYALGTTRKTLPLSTMVHLADGHTVPITVFGIPGNGWRCYDPVLESPGTSSPSARLFPGGRIFSEAGGGRTTYAVHVQPEGVEPDETESAVDDLDNTDLMEERLKAPEPTEPDDFKRRPRKLEPGERVAALPPKKERTLKKLGPGVYEAARRAKKIAVDYATMIRRAWRDNEFDRRGDNCGGKNAPHQLIAHRGTGKQSVISRDCDRLECILCGPRNLGLKLAAIFAMPLLSPEGDAIAPALGHQALFVQAVPEQSFARWRLAFFRKVKRERERVKKERETDPPYLRAEEKVIGGTVSHPPSDWDNPAYVAFSDGVSVVILSTVQTPGAEPVAPAALEPGLLMLGLWALSPLEDDGVIGNTKLFDFPGRMSSSRGLCLDPDALLKAATDNAWVMEIPHARSPQDVLELSKGRKIPATATSWDSDTGLPLIVSISAPTSEEERQMRLELFRRGEPPPPETGSTGKVVETPNFDALVDALICA